MLETLVHLMELMTRKGSINISAFQYGYHYLIKKKRQAIQATKADKAFPAKLAYMIDCVFQNWCNLMAKKARTQDFLKNACKRNLDNYLLTPSSSKVSNDIETNLVLQNLCALVPHKSQKTHQLTMAVLKMLHGLFFLGIFLSKALAGCRRLQGRSRN